MDFLGGAVPEPSDYVDFNPDSTKNAALSVAVMLGFATAILILLKRSGFRAMVAVGRS